MTRGAAVSYLVWVPVVLGLMVAALMLPSCGPGESGGARKPGPLRVVATTSIVGDLVKAVTGTHAELTVLCGPNADPHTFSPSAKAGAALLDADLVLAVGLGAEPWLEKVVESSGSKATVVELGAGFPDLIDADAAAGDGHDHGEHGHDHEHDDHDHAHSHDHDHDHDHAHGAYDPHIWHDVAAAIHITAGIRDALIKAEPAREADWRAAAETAIGQLRELDAWVQQQIATIPEPRRLLVTAHATHNYFARRYGFRVVADLIGSTSTASADPSAGAIARLVAAIKEQQVPAVFSENTTSHGVIDNVARDAGVPVRRLYTDALDEPGTEAGSYVGLMRANVRTIVDALK